MDLIATKDAALRLKISARRIQELVKNGRIPAQMIDGVYLIDSKDLALVKDRKTGRPKKEGTKKRKTAPGPAAKKAAFNGHQT